MAIKTALVFLIVTTMATTSVAQGLRNVGIVHVNGTLYCTSTGSRRASANTPIFSGAKIEVVCPADVIAYSTANATTDSNGVYLVVLIPGSNATLDSIVSSCRIFVLTPLSTCNSMLPLVGLVSNLRFVKRFPVQFWYLNYLVASGFTPQP